MAGPSFFHQIQFWGALVLAVAVAAFVGSNNYLLSSSLVFGKRNRRKSNSDVDDDINIRVAFLGNSILYFNDCPRLVEQMLQEMFPEKKVMQNSCLRGGVTLTELWHQGNGMQNKFANNSHSKSSKYDIGAPTVQALLMQQVWDYVVMNDFTRSPAREESRQETLESLQKYYIPLFQKSNNNNIKPILLQTFAYKVVGMRGSEDLGDFDEFTQRLVTGYEAYQNAIKQAGLECLVAPVGKAASLVRQQHHDDQSSSPSLWSKLYSWDDYHPSPHGTWLQACVLICTMTQQPPPRYNPNWWNVSRYMQRPEQDPLPLPTQQEAETLRQIACQVCGIDSSNNTSRQEPPASH